MKPISICVTLAAVLVGLVTATGWGQQRSALSQFMRPKLEHSQKILEGLALEDYGLITKSATALKELSEAAAWRVSPSPAYVRFSGEFQRLAGELSQKGKDKDLDGATLAYVQLTLNCVSCHKFVRENKIISMLDR